MFPPTKWNQMIERMLEDCINFPEIFRYGKPLTKILYKGTDEEFKGTLEEALASPDRTKCIKRFVIRKNWMQFYYIKNVYRYG